MRLRTLWGFVLLACAFAGPAFALPVEYSVMKELELYGKVNQLESVIQLLYGNCACAPTAAVNSFVYLQNRYPHIAGNLIEDYDGDGVDKRDHIETVLELCEDDYMDLFERDPEPWDDQDSDGEYDHGEPFIDANGNGQADGGETYLDQDGDGQYDPPEPFTDQNGNGHWEEGEYDDADGDGHRDLGWDYDDANGNGQWDPGEVRFDLDGDGDMRDRERGVCDGCLDPDIVRGKRKFLNDRTGGKIRVKGQSYTGAGGLEQTEPDWQFIYDELRRCEDVEICFSWWSASLKRWTGGHCVTAFGLRFTDLDGDGDLEQFEDASLHFIDPWGGIPLFGMLYPGDGGFLNMNYSGGAAEDAGIARIEMVISESPIPEPATLLLLGAALAGFAALRRRH